MPDIMLTEQDKALDLEKILADSDSAMKFLTMQRIQIPEEAVEIQAILRRAIVAEQSLRQVQMELELLDLHVTVLEKNLSAIVDVCASAGIGGHGQAILCRVKDLHNELGRQIERAEQAEAVAAQRAGADPDLRNLLLHEFGTTDPDMLKTIIEGWRHTSDAQRDTVLRLRSGLHYAMGAPSLESAVTICRDTLNGVTDARDIKVVRSEVEKLREALLACQAMMTKLFFRADDTKLFASGKLYSSLGKDHFWCWASQDQELIDAAMTKTREAMG